MNEIYDKDYTRPPSEVPTEPAAFFDEGDEEYSLIQLYKRYSQTVPKHIVPEDKANYDYLLRRCDEMAARCYGRVYGIVDHETYGAKIQVTLPGFFEFCDDDELLFLKEIAEKARTVMFKPVENNSILMSIFINYFEEDETFDDFFADHIQKVIDRKGLTLEETAEQCGIDLEELKNALGK